MKKLLFSILLLCSTHTLIFAQFEDEGGNDVLNTEYQDDMFREGKIGIGYNTPGSLPSGTRCREGDVSLARPVPRGYIDETPSYQAIS